MVIARRQTEEIPKLSELILARTAAEQRVLRLKVNTTQEWIEAAVKELTEWEGALLPRSAQARCSELRLEAEQLAAFVSDRAARMAASWSAPGGCPERVTRLPLQELRALSNDMTELRQQFWNRLYSFPGAARERVLAIRRCLAGELKTRSAFFTKRSDSRSDASLIKAGARVLAENGLEIAAPGMPEVLCYNPKLGTALAGLPSLPEHALEASTELQRKARVFADLTGRPASALSALTAEIEALEADLGEGGRLLSERIAEMVDARDRYLTLKTYMYTANIGLAELSAKQAATRQCTHFRDDVRQAARMGLLKAVERWDPAVGSTFSTLAKWWIDDSTADESRSARAEVKIPDHALRCFHALLQLPDDDIRRLDEHTAAARFNVEPRTFVSVRRVALGVKRLNDTVASTGEERELGSAVADYRRSEAEQEREALEAKELTRVLMQRLSSRDREVLRLRFGLGEQGEGPMTAREIGERLGITASRVRQITERSLAFLREDHRLN